ncbi:hypothetical protein [Liquorilactobacillus mali]
MPALGNEIIGKITPAKCQLIVNEWFKKPLKNYKRFANNIYKEYLIMLLD